MGKGNVQEAFQLAGTSHYYQKILVLLISVSWIYYNFVLLGSTLIYMDPVFHCSMDTSKDVFESEACPIIDQCEIVSKFTLTAQLGLYCNLQWARNIIQSIFSIGALCGLLVMNLLSDTKGRKISVIISFAIINFGILVALIGGWTKQIWLIIASQYLQGFGTSSLISLSYSLLSDFCSDKFKSQSVIVVNMAWSISTAMIGVFYLTEIKWDTFLLYLVLLPLIIVTFLLYFFLFQSPYILMNQNKKQQALQILIKVAKYNRRYENIDKITEIINIQDKRHSQNEASVKNIYKLMKKKIYLTPLIVLSFIRIFGSLNFYGTSYAFDTQGFGLGYNSIIASVSELIGFVFLSFVVHKIPRRKGNAGFCFGVVFIGMFFYIPAVRESKTAGTSLMGISRIFSTVAYTLLASMQTQSFTVQIQSTAIGVIQGFGLIGAMMGPLVVDLADKIGADPVALIATLFIFAVWPNFFLKQTNPNIAKQQDPLRQNLNVKEADSGVFPSFGSQSTIMTSDSAQ